MAKAKGHKREQFRKRIEQELACMGYSRSRYRWETAPAALTVIVGDEFRTFGIHATAGKEKVARELGKLDAWAEVLRLTPLASSVPAVNKVIRTRKTDPAQLDIVDAIERQVRAVNVPANEMVNDIARAVHSQNAV